MRALLVLVAMGACGSDSSTDGEQKAAEIVEKGPARDVDVSDVVAAYQRNSIAADDQYKGRTLRFDATMERVAESNDGTPLVFLRGYHEDGDPAAELVCQWRDRASAATIPGGHIIVRGLAAGQVAGVPRLIMCVATVAPTPPPHPVELPADLAPTADFFRDNFEKFMSGLGLKNKYKIAWDKPGTSVTVTTDDCYTVRAAVAKLGGLPHGFSARCVQKGVDNWALKN